MKILALDLGTRTGWAFRENDDQKSGTVILASPKEIREQAKLNRDRCCDIRFTRLQDFLRAFGELDVVAFEDVEFSTYTYQTQLWAGFRTVVTLEYASKPRTKLLAVPVGTLKRFATGRGNSTKSEMGAAIWGCDPKKYGRVIGERGTFYYRRVDDLADRTNVMDDNEVDALHLLRYIIRELHA